MLRNIKKTEGPAYKKCRFSFQPSIRFIWLFYFIHTSWFTRWNNASWCLTNKSDFQNTKYNHSVRVILPFIISLEMLFSHFWIHSTKFNQFKQKCESLLLFNKPPALFYIINNKNVLDYNKILKNNSIKLFYIYGCQHHRTGLQVD